MPFENKTITNVGTLADQLNVPVTRVSQPSVDIPLEQQLQGASPTTSKAAKDEVKIESVPKDQVQFYQISEDEILLDSSIEAKPLMMNESYKIKVRDPGLYAYYWGEYRAKQGLRFAQLKAMGFVPATPDEILEHQAEVLDGKIILGDVMLLKIPKNKYMSHIKNNLLKSDAMITPQHAMEQAKARAGTLVTGNKGMPNMAQHKGEFFIPNTTEVRDVPVNPLTAVEQRVYETI